MLAGASLSFSNQRDLYRVFGNVGSGHCAVSGSTSPRLHLHNCNHEESTLTWEVSCRPITVHDWHPLNHKHDTCICLVAYMCCSRALNELPAAWLWLPQEIPRYVAAGVLDAGICGYDWIVETGSDLHQVLLRLHHVAVPPVHACPTT